MREPLGGLLFNPDSPASLLTASSQPAICDDVTVEWLVSSASGSAVRVYPMITAPDGSVVHGNIETVGPEAPGMVSVSAGSSPGFPNDWTPVLRTLPEGWTPGAAPIPNPYLPAGALYNPEGLVPFWDALLDRETIMVNVAMLGDSITEGVGAPTWDQRPVIALQSRLRTAFPISGTQGPGYVAAYTWSGQIAPGLSVLAGSIRPYDQWQDANRYGLGSKAVTLLSTDHLRYDFTGTRVKVWYGWSSVAFATANGQVRIDGGAWQTMTSDAEDGSGQFWESPLLAPGPHYVEVRGTTTNVPFVLEGFEAFGSEQDHSAGVHVYDSAHSSYFSSQFTGSSVGNGSRMWQVLDKIQPVLFYVNIGVNDHAWDLTPAQTKANVEAIIARCAAAAGGKPYSVLLVVNYTPISSNPSFAANWANIRTALLSLAGGVVTVLDMNTMWPTLGPGQPQGVMLETDYPLHPNGTGHQLQVDNISNALIHGWETGEDMIGVSTDPGEPVLVHALDVTHRPILTVEECISPYRRTFNGVVTVAGPTVVEQRTLGDTTDGSTVARVEWTWVATEPHAWHDPLPILAGVDGKGSAVAYRADGVPVTDAATVTAGSTSCSRPAPTLVTCADNVLCSPAAMPPQPPALLDDCVMDLAGSTYTRRRFEIPEDLSPRGVGRLFWTFANDGKPKFGVRVRLWRDMDPAFDPEPECGFTEEFTIEYLGPNQILYIDGPGNDVYVYCGEDEFQNPIYADARRNLRGSYGGPFAVSEVGCSHGYVVAVDIPDTYTDAGLSGETVGTSQGNLTWGFDLVRRA